MASSVMQLSSAITTSLPMNSSWAPQAQRSNIASFSGLTPAFKLSTARARPCTSSKLPAGHAATKAPPQILCESKTLDQVREIIATQLSVDLSSVNPDTSFSDLGADSLDTVEIVMAMEEKFGVSISEESAEKISNVQQVADLIEKQKIAS